MRALMTADAVGGVFTYALTLIEGLAERGVETVLVLTGPRPNDAQRQLLAAVPLVACEERPYALEWMEDPWEDVARSGEWLVELVADYEPDLLHLNGYALGALEVGLPKLVVGHSCVLSWHAAVRRRPAGPEWARYREAVAAGIAGADTLVAPTRALLEELHRLYKPACPCTVIPNGITSGDSTAAEKERLVLGVGRVWDEAKNLAALDRIAERLPARVAVAGEGSPEGHVHPERLRDLYRRASVLAAPARYEPFGLAPLEAALHECALVLGDIGTLHEVWEDAAVYVDPFDDDALAAALRRLLANAPERQRLGRAARRRALSFSRERMTSRYAHLYTRLLASEHVQAA